MAPITYAHVLAVAAAAECDPRTAQRALERGTETIRSRSLRERLARAIATTTPPTWPPGIKEKRTLE